MLRMKLLIFGPPGSGKGTLAHHISTFAHMNHVSTGDIFRQHIKDKDELGMRILQINKGGFVSDEIVNEVVQNRLSKDDVKENFILDGYPRTVDQLRFLESISDITGVIFINLEDDRIIDRITRRRVCPKDGTSYHLDFKKPKVDGICDECGTPLVQREDDKKETAMKRLEVYKEKTIPIISFLELENIPMYHVRGDYDISKADSLVQKIVDFFS